MWVSAAGNDGSVPIHVEPRESFYEVTAAVTRLPMPAGKIFRSADEVDPATELRRPAERLEDGCPRRHVRVVEDHGRDLEVVSLCDEPLREQPTAPLVGRVAGRERDVDGAALVSPKDPRVGATVAGRYVLEASLGGTARSSPK